MRLYNMYSAGMKIDNFYSHNGQALIPTKWMVGMTVLPAKIILPAILTLANSHTGHSYTGHSHTGHSSHRPTLIPAAGMRGTTVVIKNLGY